MDEIIAVIAGTPIDTEMGVEFLEKKGLNAIGYPISKTAKEQSRLQLLSKEELYEMVVDIVFKAKSLGIEKVFVYCNSLSAAVDMDKVSKETGTFIVTPFIAYKDIGKEYSSLLIFAANGQSCARVEAILEETNRDIRSWSISALPLVEEIEKKDDQLAIYNRLGLDKIISWAELNDFEGIVLACTHFPYLSEVLRKNTNIQIIDPAETMYRKLLN